MKNAKSPKALALLFLLALISCVPRDDIADAREKADAVIEKLGDPDAMAMFPDKSFPASHKAQLKPLLDKLARECDYKNRKGHFVDKWSEHRAPGPSRATFIYEYYLKCDSVRFSLSYDLHEEPEFVLFAWEPLETDNPHVKDKSKSLKH